MICEWDPEKDKANVEKHGISFDEARQIFAAPVLTRSDDRQDYGERREISLGALSPEAVLVVVHTRRGTRLRLISARKANSRERKIYYGHLEKAPEGD
jgi:uncharacterized DUF497 family protein